MAILIFFYKLHLNLIYFLLKLLPVDSRKIVFLSRNFDSPPIDFRLLDHELKNRATQVRTVFLTKRICKGPRKTAEYYMHTLKQLYHIATTNVCVLDSYIIPVSTLNHRKSLRIIQLWHAMGAVKKFGYQTLDARYGRDTRLSRMMHMHEKYDFIIAGSKAMIPYYSEAFNAPEPRFLPVGLPRIDYIVSEKEVILKNIYKKNPNLRDKPVILYAPTFRLEPDDGIERLINQVDFEQYTLIIKTHPNDIRKFIDQRVTTIDGFSSMELLTAADFVITDYSAISIEASALEKRVYFYVYDYDRYYQSNGLNIDLFEEMPGCVFRDPAALIEEVERDNYDFETIRAFKRKYVINKGNAAKLIGDLVLGFVDLRI